MECPMCGCEIKPDAGEATVLCQPCKKQVPESLEKAACDPFNYAVGLRDGTTIEFESAVFQGEFVRLRAGSGDSQFKDGLYGGYPMPRGIDVRVSEIIWCCDAPFGS